MADLDGLDPIDGPADVLDEELREDVEAAGELGAPGEESSDSEPQPVIAVRQTRTTVARAGRPRRTALASEPLDGAGEPLRLESLDQHLAERGRRGQDAAGEPLGQRAAVALQRQ